MSDSVSGSPSDGDPAGPRPARGPWWRRLFFGPGWGDPVPAAVAPQEEEPPPGVPDSVRAEPDGPTDQDTGRGGPDQWYAADVVVSPHGDEAQPAPLPRDDPSTAAVDDSAMDSPPDQATVAASDDPGSGHRRLSNQATIAGTVTAGADSAVGGAVLVVLDPMGAEVTRGRSDDAGRYAVTVPTGGTYLLAVTTENHRPSIASVTVAADRVDRDFSLSTISAMGGVVRTADGGACAGASVTLIDAGGDVVAVAQTGPDGGYELADLYPGDYTLTAIVPDAGTTARPVRLTGSARQQVDVELPATGAVLGVVTRQGTDRPIADAQVAVLDSAGLLAASTVTGDDGAFRIDDLPSGPYTVVASGYSPTARPVRIQAGPGETVDLAVGHQDDTAALPRGRHARTDSAGAIGTGADRSADDDRVSTR